MVERGENMFDRFVARIRKEPALVRAVAWGAVALVVAHFNVGAVVAVWLDEVLALGLIGAAGIDIRRKVTAVTDETTLEE